MSIVKATGSKEKGYRLQIPMDAYNRADQPKEYDCIVFRDGTLVYQPVKL